MGQALRRSDSEKSNIHGTRIWKHCPRRIYAGGGRLGSRSPGGLFEPAAKVMGIRAAPRNNSSVLDKSSQPTAHWIGALSCRSLLMHFLWIFAVLITKARRCIARDRRAMAKPGSIK